jgi:hypothetical protein
MTERRPNGKYTYRANSLASVRPLVARTPLTMIVILFRPRRAFPSCFLPAFLRRAKMHIATLSGRNTSDARRKPTFFRICIPKDGRAVTGGARRSGSMVVEEEARQRLTGSSSWRSSCASAKKRVRSSSHSGPPAIPFTLQLLGL